MSTDLEGFSSRRATPHPASTPAARLARRIPRARTISIESTFLVTFPRPPSQVARTTISEVDPLPRSRAPAQAQSAAQQHYIEDEGGPATHRSIAPLGQEAPPPLTGRKRERVRQWHEYEPRDWKYEGRGYDDIAGSSQTHAARHIQAVEELVDGGHPQKRSPERDCGLCVQLVTGRKGG